MRQRLLSRAQALQLPSPQLNDLFQRLHFATQPPAAIGGWLPQLLAQWQMPRRIVRARAQPQQGRQEAESSSSDGGNSSGGGSSSSSGSNSSSSSSGDGAAARATSAAGSHAPPTAADQQAAGQQPLASIASGRLDAFYGWLPWPLTGLQGDLAFAGWDCEWLPPDRRLRSQLNGSIALVALSAFPGGSGSAAAAAATAAPHASAEVASRQSGSGSGSSSYSSGDGSGSSTNRWQPRPRCTYAHIVEAAEAAGATAVLLAAPAGRQPREANCSCPEECSAELSIPATMVPHSVGAVLRDVLRAGDRVNVSFEEVQVRAGGWKALGLPLRTGAVASSVCDSCFEEEQARAGGGLATGFAGCQVCDHTGDG